MKNISIKNIKSKGYGQLQNVKFVLKKDPKKFSAQIVFGAKIASRKVVESSKLRH